MFSTKIMRLIYGVALFTSGVCLFGAAVDQITTSATTFCVVGGLATMLAALTALVPPKS